MIGVDVPVFLRDAHPLLAGVASSALTGAQWAEVDTVLTALAAAVDAEDAGAAGRELARLAQVVSGTRVGRTLNPAAGDPPREGPGEATRAVLNHLVHSLVAERPEAERTEKREAGR